MNIHILPVKLAQPYMIEQARRAFTLIELLATITILMILMTIGIRLMTGNGQQCRRTSTDLLVEMIEQARTIAITSRSYIILAIAEPGDVRVGDERYRIGLFQLASWPETDTDELAGCVMTRRWRELETGIVLMTGSYDGMTNPLDETEFSVLYGSEAQPKNIKVHIMAFNPRGSLHHPKGSGPITMRIAEGNYREGRAIPNRRGDFHDVTESCLKIGRITARPYRIGG